MAKNPKKMRELGLLNVKAEASDFDRLVDEFLGTEPTYKAAYHAAEEVHEKQTGHRRYSDHESYRVSRSRRIRKKK